MKTKQQYHKIKIGKEENKNYNTNYIEKQKKISNWKNMPRTQR